MRSLLPAAALAAVLASWTWAGPVRADLSLSLGVAAGVQYDYRDCTSAGGSHVFRGSCPLFAAGLDLSLLWRARLGAMLGLYSISGQAAQAPPQATQPAIPDRVSLPALLAVRPAAFFLAPQDRGYLARFLRGLGVAFGPSVEIVRTSADSEVTAGLHLLGQVEVPLWARTHTALRLTARFLYAPEVSFNSGAVVSQDKIAQTEAGFVFYP